MYGVMFDVPAPAELYHQVADAIDRAQDGVPTDGLLSHVCMATDSGFRIIEVWTSKAACDRFGQELVGPTIDAVAGDAADTVPTTTEFEVLGLRPQPSGTEAALPGARASAEDTQYIG
jgi:hypothetical protein